MRFFLSLRRIKSIKGLLSLEFLKTLVLNQMDYGNVIFPGLFKYQKCRLQFLINTTVRLITSTRKYFHSSIFLRNLHWPDEKIDYEVLLLMFKFLSNEGLAYLSRNFEILSSILGKQKLRPANLLNVVLGKGKLKTTGSKIFM